MMDGIQFGWIGATRRQAINVTLGHVLSAWQQDWAMRGGDGTVAIDAASEWPSDAMVHSLPRWRSAGGACAVHLRGSRYAVLGRWLAGMHEDDGVGLAESLGRDALADLARRVHAAAGGTSPALAAADADTGVLDGLRASAGACHASFKLGGADIDVLLDRAMCASLAPLAPAREGQQPALVARGATLGEVGVRLDAHIDFGMACLADLSNLQVGELLVSDTPLTAPLGLGTGTGRPLLAARLSQHEGAYALRIETLYE
jgi:hypothetical protein